MGSIARVKPLLKALRSHVGEVWLGKKPPPNLLDCGKSVARPNLRIQPDYSVRGKHFQSTNRSLTKWHNGKWGQLKCVMEDAFRLVFQGVRRQGNLDYATHVRNVASMSRRPPIGSDRIFHIANLTKGTARPNASLSIRQSFGNGPGLQLARQFR